MLELTIGLDLEPLSHWIATTEKPNQCVPQRTVFGSCRVLSPELCPQGHAYLHLIEKVSSDADSLVTCKDICVPAGTVQYSPIFRFSSLPSMIVVTNPECRCTIMKPGSGNRSTFCRPWILLDHMKAGRSGALGLDGGCPFKSAIGHDHARLVVLVAIAVRCLTAQVRCRKQKN